MNQRSGLSAERCSSWQQTGQRRSAETPLRADGAWKASRLAEEPLTSRPGWRINGPQKFETWFGMSKNETKTAEAIRLQEDAARMKNWKRWGPYLSERQWGTVREDYSPDGTCWEYFPH